MKTWNLRKPSAAVLLSFVMRTQFWPAYGEDTVSVDTRDLASEGSVVWKLDQYTVSDQNIFFDAELVFNDENSTINAGKAICLPLPDLGCGVLMMQRMPFLVYGYICDEPKKLLRTYTIQDESIVLTFRDSTHSLKIFPVIQGGFILAPSLQKILRRTGTAWKFRGSCGPFMTEQRIL